MVSITLSVSEETRKKMKEFDEVNWSALIRKFIESKTQQLSKFEEIKKQFENEQEITDWAVKLQRVSRSGRLDTLKKKGLL